MSPPDISLLAVTVAFTGLVIWVYWPSHRQRLESFGSMPLDDDDSSEGSTANAGSGTHPEKKEKNKEQRP